MSKLTTTVHVLVIDHPHGMDIVAFATPQEMDDAKYEFVKKNWDDVAGLEGVPKTAPENKEEAIDIYVDKNASGLCDGTYFYSEICEVNYTINNSICVGR